MTVRQVGEYSIVAQGEGVGGCCTCCAILDLHKRSVVSESEYLI